MAESVDVQMGIYMDFVTSNVEASFHEEILKSLPPRLGRIAHYYLVLYLRKENYYRKLIAKAKMLNTIFTSMMTILELIVQ